MYETAKKGVHWSTTTNTGLQSRLALDRDAPTQENRAPTIAEKQGVSLNSSFCSPPGMECAMYTAAIAVQKKLTCESLRKGINLYNDSLDSGVYSK